MSIPQESSSSPPDLAKSEAQNHFKHHVRDEELDHVVFYPFSGCNDLQQPTARTKSI
ncbi:hypothetical protein [Halobacillus sp. K22]|uniref:hypothetical protein n=1 Tax=Halobacillus sp. K22 TaxID=3457431 RepID=UPI003FCE1352